ncbi:MAG: dehydratase [Elusimicrobia bacterium]|nr:dehydratase [Elusimicrobiota bacterium]
MIERFAELSGDKGRHHLEADAQGRVMAHGLLTATLPTELGGRLDYMAQEMLFEFVGAVYAGDELECTGVVESAVKKPLSWRLSFSFRVVNQDGKLVLKGTTAGIVLRDPARARP